MVMLTEDLAFSFEFEKLKSDLQNARENYIALVEEYNHLINVVGKNLENEYMLKLGKKEYELFSCQVEILRLKREISIFQAARNRGEEIPAEKVKQIIENEFAEYQEQLKIHQEKLQLAEQQLNARPFTDEETRAFKKLYHNIVHKLHPDLNPHLPPGAALLWERVQAAYKANLWDELFLLADMVDDLLEGKIDYVESLNSMEQLREEMAKITQKIANLERQLSDTRKRVPFSYENLLENPTEVRQKREELKEQIRLCQMRIAELKTVKAQF